MSYERLPFYSFLLFFVQDEIQIQTRTDRLRSEGERGCREILLGRDGQYEAPRRNCIQLRWWQRRHITHVCKVYASIPCERTTQHSEFGQKVNYCLRRHFFRDLCVCCLIMNNIESDTRNNRMDRRCFTGSSTFRLLLLVCCSHRTLQCSEFGETEYAVAHASSKFWFTMFEWEWHCWRFVWFFLAIFQSIDSCATDTL